MKNIVFFKGIGKTQKKSINVKGSQYNAVFLVRDG